MYLLLNLIVPFVAVLFSTGNAGADPMAFFKSIAVGYGVISLPYWIWAAISSYFEMPKKITNGGFIGAHFLLLAVTILVSQSKSAEASGGWFIFIFLSPIFILIGSLVSRFFKIKD